MIIDQVSFGFDIDEDFTFFGSSLYYNVLSPTYELITPNLIAHCNREKNYDIKLLRRSYV
jgi:hypothetical protein